MNKRGLIIKVKGSVAVYYGVVCIVHVYVGSPR